ncbi:MAG: four helix bundle protein [Bacteroidota bacterium]
MDFVEDGNEVYGNLQKRLFDFSVYVIKESRKLPESREYRIIVSQLIKSATSTAANYEEAQAGVSRSDFSNKIAIALKEIRETNYWIRLIISIDDKNNHWNKINDESVELMKILGSIYSKTSKPRNF